MSFFKILLENIAKTSAKLLTRTGKIDSKLFCCFFSERCLNWWTTYQSITYWEMVRKKKEERKNATNIFYFNNVPPSLYSAAGRLFCAMSHHWLFDRFKLTCSYTLWKKSQFFLLLGKALLLVWFLTILKSVMHTFCITF